MAEQRDPELLAKMQCIAALFADTTWHDPFLNENLRTAIEAALAEGDGRPAPLDKVYAKAVELRESRGGVPSFLLQHLNLRDVTWEPLFVREQLVGCLKRLAGYERGLLVVSGLWHAISQGGRRTRRREQLHDEARRYIDALTARFAAPGCCLTILYLD